MKRVFHDNKDTEPSVEPEPLSIRWIDAQAVTLRPGDTIVLSYPHPMPSEMITRLMEKAQAFFPEHKVLVLDDGMRLGVLTPEDHPG